MNKTVEMKRQLSSHQGFTLVELMIALIIISILMAMAIPVYQEYTRRSDVAKTQQEMLKIAEQLERHKARNFSYRGFNANYLYTNSAGTLSTEFDTANQKLNFPLSQTKKFEINIVDSMAGNPVLTDNTALGQNWVIQATSMDARNFNLLLTSTGIRCKNKNTITYTDCSTDGENW